MIAKSLRLRIALFALVVGSTLISLPTSEVVLALNQTQLSQTINTGTLGVDVVDASGVAVGSPSAAFSTLTFSFDPQTSTATLGTSSQRVRVSNGTSTATWNLAMAATSGPTALWTTGSITMDFNGSASQGRLTVDPSAGTITPTNSYTTTGLTRGSSTAFAQGTTDSVTLLTAGATADRPGRWDFTAVTLTQDVPATQSSGTYTLTMTLTVT